MFRFGNQVERVGREALANGKYKSLILDNGDIKLRHTKGGIKIVDDAEAKQVALGFPAEKGLYRVKTEYSVNKTALKTFLEDKLKELTKQFDGDIEAAESEFRKQFPFAAIEQDRDVFSADPATDKKTG